MRSQIFSGIASEILSQGSKNQNNNNNVQSNNNNSSHSNSNNNVQPGPNRLQRLIQSEPLINKQAK
jgi:hypothetical protein